jgi:hypothetical protein
MLSHIQVEVRTMHMLVFFLPFLLETLSSLAPQRSVLLRRNLLCGAGDLLFATEFKDSRSPAQQSSDLKICVRSSLREG